MFITSLAEPNLGSEEPMIDFTIKNSLHLAQHILEVRCLLEKDKEFSTPSILNRGDWEDALQWLESIRTEMMHLEVKGFNSRYVGSSYSVCLDLAEEQLSDLLDKPEITALRLKIC